MVALAQWIEAKAPDVVAENRVWDFLGEPPNRVRRTLAQVADCDREITLVGYDSCRGVSLAQSGQTVFAEGTPDEAYGDGIGVKADLNLTTDGWAVDDTDTFTVKGHGRVGVIIVGATNQELNGVQLAQLILSHPEYANSVDCILYVCNAGTGANSLAQQVADTTFLIVYAADGWVGQQNHVVYAGTKVVNGKAVGINPWKGVDWRTFHPDDLNRVVSKINAEMSASIEESAMNNISVSLPNP